MGETQVEQIGAELAVIRDSGTGFPVLRAILACRVRGVAAGPELHATIARAFDRRENDVRQVATWVEQILAAEASDDRILHRCCSISCSSRGADRLWGEIEGLLVEAGLRLPIVEVHCLSQCENGPSLGCGDRIYVGGEERVVEDDRPWRETPFGRES